MACLQTKAGEMCALLTKVVFALEHPSPRLEQNQSEFMSQLPERQDIVNTWNDMHSTRARIDELKEQLKGMAPGLVD